MRLGLDQGPPLIIAARRETDQNMYKISGISNKENYTTDHLPRAEKLGLQTGLQLLSVSLRLQMIHERLEAGHGLHADRAREEHLDG